MRKFGMGLLVGLLCLAIGQAGPDPDWRTQMREFRSALGDLMPYLASIKSFNEPQNAITIQSKVQKLSDIRKLLYHHESVGNPDPTIAYIANAFDMNIQAIEENISSGRRDYARYLLMNTASYCIACHTQSAGKGEFLNQGVPSLVSMIGPVERVEYLISTRQFKEAMSAIEEAFNDKDFGSSNLNSDRIALYGVTLSVRHFKDPEQLEKLIRLLDRPKQVPFFLESDLKAWKKALAEWRKTKAPSPSQIAKAIRFSEDLMQKAEKINSKLDSDHAGAVYALQASALATDILAQKITKTEAAKVLMILGDSYQDATDGLFWTFPQYYYEACIRTLPHTPQAGTCYRKFEDAVRFAYSNTMAMIPPRMVTQLKELKALSERPQQKN